MSNRLTAILEASLRATAYVMGGEITYSDGEDSATFDATFGRSAFEVSDGSVARIEYNDHDFIFPAALLVLRGTQKKPQKGHRITVTDGPAGEIFEVLAPNDGPPFAYCDALETVLRVHTKRIA
jgi:hypothetical protein